MSMQHRSHPACVLQRHPMFDECGGHFRDGAVRGQAIDQHFAPETQPLGLGSLNHGDSTIGHHGRNLLAQLPPGAQEPTGIALAAVQARNLRRSTWCLA